MVIVTAQSLSLVYIFGEEGKAKAIETFRGICFNIMIKLCNFAQN